MNLDFSSALGWVVAVAIAVPFIAMFWWARRNAPVVDYEMDYSVARRSKPLAEPTITSLPPVAHGTTDAPVPANPAALAPPTETAEPPASTTTLPAHAPMPPEPPTLATTAPAAPAAKNTTPEAPVAACNDGSFPGRARATQTGARAPAAAIAPAVAAAPKAPAEKPAPPKPAATPVVAKAPEAKAEPKPAAPPPPPAPEPEPEPEPAAVEAAAPAAAASSEAADDFSRLYGIDAAAGAALQGAGIVTYRQLAGANVDHLKEILAGIGQAGTDPATWPQQARFAAGGKWKILDARFKK